MAHYFISLLSITLLFVTTSLVRSIEIKELKDACSTCIQTSPRFWYSCNQCFDNQNEVAFCGYTVNQLLRCPQANRKANYCHNAYINDALIGAFESNYYQMQPGDSCMIIIKNGITDEENTVGYWKIWKDQKDLQFFLAPNLNSTDDNVLDKVAHPGDVEEIERGKTLYLFVTNPTLKKRSFQLNFAGANSLIGQIQKHLYLMFALVSILIYF